MRQFSHSARAVLCLVALADCARAAASDADKLLPKESEFAVGINFKQAVNSGIVKKYIETVKKENEGGLDANVQQVLDALGFNPLTDLHELVFAGVAEKDSDKGLMIVRGQFDVAKFEAKASELAQTFGDWLKADKIGVNKVYLLAVGTPPKSILLTMPNKSTILAAANKTWMTEALDNIANQRATKVESKELQALLAKVDPMRSFWVAIPGASMKKMPIDEGKLKENVNDIESISGGITLADDIKIEFAVVKSNPESAKELAKAANEVVRPFRMTFWSLPPLQKLIDTINISTDESTVRIESHLSAEFLSRLADELQAQNKNTKATTKQ